MLKKNVREHIEILCLIISYSIHFVLTFLFFIQQIFLSKNNFKIISLIWLSRSLLVDVIGWIKSLQFQRKTKGGRSEH